jgi:hypothetical protein
MLFWTKVSTQRVTSGARPDVPTQGAVMQLDLEERWHLAGLRAVVMPTPPEGAARPAHA